jgi:hypothetical protein
VRQRHEDGDDWASDDWLAMIGPASLAANLYSVEKITPLGGPIGLFAQRVKNAGQKPPLLGIRRSTDQFFRQMYRKTLTPRNNPLDSLHCVASD